MSDRPPAIVLLSGGLDSATCLHWAIRRGWRPVAVSFDYGQRHRAELSAAAHLARAAGVEHLVLDLAAVGALGGSVLTDPALAAQLPLGRSDDEIRDDHVPATYVPARNAVLLAVALAVAEARDADHLVIGVNALDYSGYPDCRPEFIAAFETMANLATRRSTELGRRLRVHAPLQHCTKADIVRLAVELGVPLAETVSCYDAAADGRACGGCDACRLRRRGFAQAGVEDPTRYRVAPDTAGATDTADTNLR